MSMAVGDECVVDFSLAAFSVEAIKRAAYALMASYDIGLQVDDGRVRCALKAARPDVDLTHAERDLRREVVDQDLRISIEHKTEGYRDLILGLAFSKTGLQGG